jgi:short subunit dehydrogenase-like uncharacterized protein
LARSDAFDEGRLAPAAHIPAVSTAGRDFDVVVYGASGFAGRQVVRYLAAHPQRPSLRWALAGRDPGKLEAARDAAGGDTPAVLVGDATDPSAIDAIASRARVVLNTAGPFALYGDAMVDACVRFGTHYVDITGETPWVRELIDRHHERAAAAGTRIVPCCGFDSVPSDLGAFLAVRELARLGTPARAVKAYFSMRGGVNGGTIATLMALGADPAKRALLGDPFLLDPPRERSAGELARSRDPQSARFDPDAGGWVSPFFMGPINTRVVRRSAALYAQLNEPYGPDFTYQEYLRFGAGGALPASLVAGGSALFMSSVAFPAPREFFRALLPKPGAGPSERAMNEGRFRCTLAAHGEDGKRVRGVMADSGDPGNRATAKMVCEAALALVFDAERLPGGPARGGLLTPATAFGNVLAERLRSAGMTVEAGAA